MRENMHCGASRFKDFIPYQLQSDEVYMNNRQQDHFRHILQVWKATLIGEAGRTANHIKDDTANFPDMTDRASQEEEFSIELRTRDRERKLIDKINATLELILANDYGYCKICGEEIGILRLEARPTASMCIDCKTIDEIKEKQNTG